LRRSALVSILGALVCLTSPVWSQESGSSFGGVQSFGFTASYSPDSSHILIGDAGQRRIWTAGAGYAHLLHRQRRFRLDYEASLMPFFLESDPTVTGTYFTSDGVTFSMPQSPERVVRVVHGPVGSVVTGSGASVPLYANFGRESSYAVAVAPLGARISALPHSRIQPTFAIDLGFVVSSVDLPVFDSSRFNFTFAMGPGIQYFVTARDSVRLEYVYRHTSNAGLGDQNPGLDQGVIRLTLSRHR
jgi:opacity protein-like surface antigen